jgi:hypothetical protein
VASPTTGKSGFGVGRLSIRGSGWFGDDSVCGATDRPNKPGSTGSYEQPAMRQPRRTTAAPSRPEVLARSTDRCYDGASCGAVTEVLGMITTAAANSTATTAAAKKTLCKAGSKTLTGIALVVEEM